MIDSARDAKEIIELWKKPFFEGKAEAIQTIMNRYGEQYGWVYLVGRAEEYLNALQCAEVKALEKTLEIMSQELRAGTGYRIGSGATAIWLSRIDESLAQYREAVRP